MRIGSPGIGYDGAGDGADHRGNPKPASRVEPELKPTDVEDSQLRATIAVMARDKLLAFLTHRDAEATNTSPAAPLAVIRNALAALRPSEPRPHQVDRGD